MAYVDSIGIICYSHWVVYTDSISYFFFVIASGWLTSILLALCVLASGWLVQFHVVSFCFISFTCSASGWPVCSQWVVYAVSFCCSYFPRSRPLGLGTVA